jgi:hypothetical protein
MPMKNSAGDGGADGDEDEKGEACGSGWVGRCGDDGGAFGENCTLETLVGRVSLLVKQTAMRMMRRARMRKRKRIDGNGKSRNGKNGKWLMPCWMTRRGRLSRKGTMKRMNKKRLVFFLPTCFH